MTSDRPCRQATGRPLDLGQDLDPGPDPLDDRRPDEHGVHRRLVEAGDVEVGLERVDLAPEGVAAHGDVDGPEASAGRRGRRAPRGRAGSSRRRCRARACLARAARPAGRTARWRRAASTSSSTRRPGGPGRRRRRGQRACAPRRASTPSRVSACDVQRRPRPAGRARRRGPCTWGLRSLGGHGPADAASAGPLTSRGRRAWCRACRSRGRAWPHRGPGSPWRGCRRRGSWWWPRRWPWPEWRGRRS